jgi:hypothetical protein
MRGESCPVRWTGPRAGTQEGPREGIGGLLLIRDVWREWSGTRPVSPLPQGLWGETSDAKCGTILFLPEVSRTKAPPVSSKDVSGEAEE